MENWNDYPFKPENKAFLGYLVQQMLGTNYGRGLKSYDSYQNPYTGNVGPNEYNRMGFVDNNAINMVMDALKNKYQPAIQAREDFGRLPNSARQYYSRMFDIGR